MLILGRFLAVACLFPLLGTGLSVAASPTRVLVVSPVGDPLPGVVVRRLQTNKLQIPPTDDQWTTIGVTSADGTFTPDSVRTPSLILLSGEGLATLAFDGESPLPPRILLYNDAPFSGAVVNADGTSVAGALIGPVLPSEGEEGLLAAIPGENPILPPVWTRTDSAGRFRVQGLHPGFYHFVVNASESGPQMAAAQTGEETSITLTGGGTTCTGVLFGSRDRLPQPDVWVEAASEVFLLMKLYSKSGPDGEFRFPPLRPELGWKFTTSRDPAEIARPAGVLNQEHGPESFRLQLLHNQGVTVAGRIFDSETSVPVSGLRLKLSQIRGTDELTTSTNGDGSFRFENAAAFHDLSLRFENSGYVYLSPAEGRWNEKVAISTHQGEDITTVDLGLRKRVRVNGKVVGPGKRPLPGAHVVFRSQNLLTQGYEEMPRRMTYRAVTDALGEFLVHLFPPGRFDVTAAAGMFASGPVTYDAFTTAPAELLISVRPLQSLKGQILDPEGTPLIGGRVEMTQLYDAAETTGLSAGRLVQAASCTDTGAFSFEGIFPEAFRLTAFHPLFDVTATTEILSLPTTGTIALQFPPSNLLKVHVADDQGDPVGGATVQLYTSTRLSHQTSGSQYMSHPTTSQGEALFALHRDVLEKMVIRHPGYVTFTAENIPLPNTSLEVRLRPHPSVVVTLEAPPGAAEESLPRLVWLMRGGASQETTEPLPSYFVTLRQAQATDGEAVFNSVEPGWYKAAIASVDDIFYSETQAFQVKADSGSLQVRLPLARGASLSGRITDEATGKPVSGAEVGVMLQSGTPSDFEIVSKPSDARGYYRIGALPSGVVAITATHRDYPSRAQMRTIPVAGHVDLDIKMSQSRTSLGGRVTLAGRSLPNATVVVYQNEDMGPWLGSDISDENGRYRIDGVPEGLRTIVVEALWGDDSKALRQRHNLLMQGNDTGLDVDFLPLVRLHGFLRIDSADDDPERSLTLWFTRRHSHGDIRRAPVGVDGHYEVFLEPGSYIAALADGPGAPLDIPEGTAEFQVDFDYAPLAEISGLDRTPDSSSE